MCPEAVVSDIDGRQNAPCAVDLRVVLVEFGDEEEERSEEKREGEGEGERIGAEVENAQFGQLVAAQECGVDLLRKGIELRDVWADG